MDWRVFITMLLLIANGSYEYSKTYGIIVGLSCWIIGSKYLGLCHVITKSLPKEEAFQCRLPVGSVATSSRTELISLRLQPPSMSSSSSENKAVFLCFGLAQRQEPKSQSKTSQPIHRSVSTNLP